jgi:hypothetical protein
MRPIAIKQYPNWEIVLKAIILFISFCNKPLVAANIAVSAPIIVIIANTVGLYSKIGLDLINKYKPAVTNVAACNKLLTGVGEIIVNIKFLNYNNLLLWWYIS